LRAEKKMGRHLLTSVNIVIYLVMYIPGVTTPGDEIFGDPSDAARRANQITFNL